MAATDKAALAESGRAEVKEEVVEEEEEQANPQAVVIPEKGKKVRGRLSIDLSIL